MSKSLTALRVRQLPRFAIPHADKLVGLDSPDAEREAIRKAGGDDLDFHGTAPAQASEPKIIVPEKSDATPEGRDAIRALLEKK